MIARRLFIQFDITFLPFFKTVKFQKTIIKYCSKFEFFHFWRGDVWLLPAVAGIVPIILLLLKFYESSKLALLGSFKNTYWTKNLLGKKWIF